MDVPWEHEAKPPTAPCKRGQAWTQGQSSSPNAWANKFLKKIPLVGLMTSLSMASHIPTPPLGLTLSLTLLSSGPAKYSFQIAVRFFLVLVFFLFFPLGDMFIRKISETSGAACASNSFSKRIMSQE